MPLQRELGILMRTVSEQRQGGIGESSPALRLVVIGASAGGIHSILEVVSGLDPELPVGVLIVQHLAPTKLSYMAELLSSHTKMKVRQVEGGERIARASIYTSVPGQHVLVQGDLLVLSNADPVRHQRPSIDMSFRSAAHEFGDMCTGVILSGMLADGAEGIRAVKHAAGVTIVEDPETAEFDGMPKAAIATGCVDYILKPTDIGPLLNKICAG